MRENEICIVCVCCGKESPLDRDGFCDECSKLAYDEIAETD